MKNKLAVLALAATVAASAPIDAAEIATAGKIELSSMVIDPHQLPNLSEAEKASAQTEILLVQLEGAASRDRLEAAGFKVYTYLPHDTFLARVPLTRRESLAALGVRFSGAFHPAYKIGRDVRAAAAQEGARRFQLMVQVFPDADLAAVVEKMHTLEVPGILASGRASNFSRIRVELTGAEIERFVDVIARLEEVFWISVEPRRALLNDTTAWVAQSGMAGGQTTPVHAAGLNGAGQVVAVLDTGIDPDLCFFRDTTLGLPPTNACDGGTTFDNNQRKVIAVNFLWQNDCNGGIGANEWDNHDHGSHVAGTVAGDNFANLGVRDAADGLAPGTKLVIQDGGLTTDNCADLPGIGCPVVDLNPIFQQTYDQGARIHTNSWGDNENAAFSNNYSVAAQDADEFMWNHKDFLLFFAAGNNGNAAGKVVSPSTAKSVMSVGSTLRGASAESISGFSSCGFTDDNRIKPEIMMPGSSIISGDSDNNVNTNNCGTRSMSGTSMATPGAAGAGALVRQYFADGFYPSGAAVPADAFSPSAALVRATLVNSATSMANLPIIPANCQGWGRVLLDNALAFAADNRKLWVEDNASFAAAGEEQTYLFDVIAGEALKVTLAWTDFPSTPAAAIHLVNDLDLVVEGPNGQFLGNVWSGGQSTSGGSADRRNTLEQVLIQAPTSGQFTVTVRAHAIPSGPQPFALLISGALTEDTSSAIFRDGFESAGTTRWSSVSP